MSQTMTCQKDESQFTLDHWLHQAKCCGQVDHYLGKRQTVRFQWQSHVQIEVRSPNGTVEYLYATTKDISENGLALMSRQPIDPRAQIRIQLDDEDQFGIVSGTVVHCTQTVGSFIIGIQCDQSIAA